MVCQKLTYLKRLSSAAGRSADVLLQLVLLRVLMLLNLFNCNLDDGTEAGELLKAHS